MGVAASLGRGIICQCGGPPAPRLLLEDAKCFHHLPLFLLLHILQNISTIFPSLSFIKLSWSPDSLLHEIIWVLLWATRALHIHWTLNIHWILFIVLLWTPPWTVHKDKDYHMMITTALMSMAMMMMKTFTMMMMIMMIRHGAWWWWWWWSWGMMDLCELQLFGWQLPLSHFPYSDTFLLPHPPPLNTQMLFYFSTPSTPLLPKSSNTFLLLVKFHRPACHLGGTLNWKTCLIFNLHPILTDFSQIAQIEQGLKDLVFCQRPNMVKKSPAPLCTDKPN